MTCSLHLAACKVHDRFRDFSQGPDGGFEITD